MSIKITYKFVQIYEQNANKWKKKGNKGGRGKRKVREVEKKIDQADKN